MFFKKTEIITKDCVEDLTVNYQYKTEAMKSMFSELNITYYSQKLCQKYVYNQYVFNSCGCYDPSLYTTNQKVYCTNPDKVRCMETTFSRYYSNLIDTPNNTSFIQCPQG